MMRSISWLAAGIVSIGLVACTNGDAPDNQPEPQPEPSATNGNGAIDDQPPQRVHALQIRRFQSVGLSDERTDVILADATEILQRQDGPDDTACSVSMERNGPVTPFDLGNGVISSAADFTEVLGQPGDIHIVNAINWCGGPGVGIIGCAPVPGGALVAVRFDEPLEGILWAHEFGHNQGLRHRNGVELIMNPFITPTAFQVNAAECGAFLQPTPATSGESTLLAASAMQDDTPSQLNEAERVRAFVRAIYPEGLPIEQAQDFGPEAVPVLQAILDNPEDKYYWPNALGVMGLIGAEPGTESLIDFVDEHSRADGGVDPATYRAVLSAYVALGYAAHESSNDRAIAYLFNSAEALTSDPANLTAPDYVAGDGLWLSPVVTGQSAVLGLAVSGREEAVQMLDQLAEQCAAAGLDSASAFAQDAQSTLQQVRSLGLQGYYARSN